MILHPPERFDINEWFIIISVTLVLFIAFLLPKRFSTVQNTIIVVFTVFISQTVDSMIAVKPFDLYDVNDSSKYEIMDVIIYYVSYPPVGYLFLYFYDKWRLKGWYCILYVVVFSILTTFIEWLAVLVHVFTFKGWQTWYSTFVYIVVFTLYILLLHLTEKLLDPKKERAMPPQLN